MFKKSILVVLIQIIGMLLSLISVYFIAGDMEPEVYSLVGVYGVISSIILTFSNLGIETIMGREALYWIEHNQITRFKEYASQGFFARVIGTIILCPFILVYIIYLNERKYDGERLVLLLFMLLGAIVNALIDSLSLIVRSKGGYVFCQATRTINTYALKTLGIFIYLLYGADYYLYFYALSSIPILFIFCFVLRKDLRISYINMRGVWNKVVEGRFLWINSDITYFRGNLDSLIVSAFFPPAIMGAYTVLKSLQHLGKGVVEGFFDVLSQSTVRYKGNEEKLIIQEKKIRKARNICLIVLLIGTCVFSYNPTFFIELVNLEQYEGMESIIYCVIICIGILLVGKYEINAISFFAPSKTILHISIIATTLAFSSYLIVVVFPTLNGMLFQQIGVYMIETCVAIIAFKKLKRKMYNQINK